MSNSQSQKYVAISVKRLTEMLKPFRPMRCWEVNLLYGSVVAFEMGEKIKRKSLRNIDYFSGSVSLWLEGDVWTIYEQGQKITDSESVCRNFVETVLRKKFVGKCLGLFSHDRESRDLSVSFGRNVKVVVSQKIIEMDEATDFINLFLPNGNIVGWTTKRGLYVTKETKSPSRKS